MSAATEAQTPPFSPRAVLIIIAAAVIALAAFALLLAFGGDFRSGHDARAHALSVSADGYAGLVALVDDVGAHSLIVRDPDKLDTRALLIVTPEAGYDDAALPKLLARRGDAPTLIVLPKWSTQALPANRDWVAADGPLPPFAISTPLNKVATGLVVEDNPAAVAVASPDAHRLATAQIGPQKIQQRIRGGGIVPLLTDAENRIVLARVPEQPVYILAEPDLFNNLGLADRNTARQAWAIVDDLSTTNEVAFDLTLNGFATQRSTIRLLFEPPFLPVTICVFAAALLAGLHGAIRFGAPEPAAREIAFGKRTLVDNAAQLFRAARKEHKAGAAYAALTRDLTAQATGAPAWLTGDALDTMLDRAAPDAADPPFATLAWHAGTAQNRDDLVAAAQALYRWRRNRTR